MFSWKKINVVLERQCKTCDILVLVWMMRWQWHTWVIMERLEWITNRCIHKCALNQILYKMQFFITLELRSLTRDFWKNQLVYLNFKLDFRMFSLGKWRKSFQQTRDFPFLLEILHYVVLRFIWFSVI
mgnify:CR=1 FL=1